jgi:DNA polymerase I-like protein with 3'-5' exonuclease and polymerase domains
MPILKRMLLERFGEVGYQRWLDDGAPATLAIDTETEGTGYFDRAFCVTFTWRRPDGTLRDAYFETSMNGDEYRYNDDYVRRMLAGSKTWIFHNAKFDLQKILQEEWASRADYDTKVIHDTEAIFHLLNNVDRKGLKYLAGEYLGEENREPEKRLAKVRRKLGIKKEDGYFFLPREYVVPYAMKDTELTYKLAVLGLPMVQKQEKLYKLYQSEMELCLYMLDMEAAGMKLNVDYCKKMASEYGTKIMSTLNRIRELSGNPELNPASPKQLTAAFAARGLNLASTNEETLLPLDDELAKLVLDYRGFMKMHKTYFVALLDEQRDGIVHPSFRQHGARTGRMSSGKAVE